MDVNDLEYHVFWIQSCISTMRADRSDFAFDKGVTGDKKHSNKSLGQSTLPNKRI
jgi:hypothetical protein